MPSFLMSRTRGAPASLLFLSLFVLAACNDGNADQAAGPNAARPVKIVTAVSATTPMAKTFPGITDATQKAALAFRVGGQVSELPVLAGKPVKKGDLIARLDEAEYKAVLADRDARYQLAKTQYDRQAALYKKKHVAKSALDQAEAQLAIANADLKRARDNMAYTQIHAPFDGVMARVDVETFQNVKKDEPVAQFYGTKNLDVTFNVPESMLLMAAPKDPRAPMFLVRFTARPDRLFTARYRKHDAVPDPATRSYKVTVSLPYPTGMIVLPGMSANVDIDLAALGMVAETGSVFVPVESLFEDGGRTWVWTVSDDLIVTKTEVRANGIEQTYVRILSGLEAGQKVVAAGVSHITEGQAVRSLSKERGL